MLLLDTHTAIAMSADAGLPTQILHRDVDKDVAEMIEPLVLHTVQMTSLQLVMSTSDIIICLHVSVHCWLMTSNLGAL